MAGRGQYDRRTAPAARWAEHRADLVQAAAEEIVGGSAIDISVDRVTRRAGRGRNTFYAHFRDVGQVLRAVESSVLSRVAAAAELGLANAWSPAERLRALADAWLDVADANSTAFRAMLLVTAPGGRVTARAHDLLRQLLRRVLDESRDDGALSVPHDDVRVALLAGAWDGGLRAYIEQRAQREWVAAALVDVSLRMFR